MSIQLGILSQLPAMPSWLLPQDFACRKPPDWVQPVVTACSALFAAFVAWLAFRTNAAVNLRNKRMDVIANCNSRYDELYKSRIEIEGRLQKGEGVTFPTKAYFRRYWGLKSDQLDYWLAGYVDPETAASWFTSVADAIVARGNVGKDNIVDNWAWESRRVNIRVNDRLVELVDFFIRSRQYMRTIEIRFALTLQYPRILETTEHSFILRLSKNNHRRFIIGGLVATLQKTDRRNYDLLETSPCVIVRLNLLSRSLVLVRRAIRRALFGGHKERIDMLQIWLRSLPQPVSESTFPLRALKTVSADEACTRL